MQPEMIRELQVLQTRAAQLGSLARGLSQAAPERAEGSDATGSVNAVLDRAGRPSKIEILDGWDQRIDVDRLGAAVAEACADAVRQGMRTWSAALDESHWYRQRSAFAHGDDPAGEDDVPDLPVGEAREVTELAEEVISRLRSAAESPSSEISVATGSDDEAHVTVRLVPGGAVSCTVDDRWAARQSGATITRALATALDRARAELGRRNTSAANVDGLLGDVLTTLEAFKNQ